jgi:phage gp46-like protein
MNITDIRLVEKYDGGDYVLNANDVQLISGFQNMPYIGLFGGNLEQNTTGAKQVEQEFDFWGNYLLHPSLQKVWINSRTEQLLKEVALTSAGRIQIEQQVKKDIEFMQEFAEVSVSVRLNSVDRIIISITLNEPNKLNSTELIYIWDSTNSELSMQMPENGSNVFGLGLDLTLDNDL